MHPVPAQVSAWLGFASTGSCPMLEGHFAQPSFLPSSLISPSPKDREVTFVLIWGRSRAVTGVRGSQKLCRVAQSSRECPQRQECPPLTLHHRVAGVELSPAPHAAESRDLPVLLALLDGGVNVLACGTAGIEGGRRRRRESSQDFLSITGMVGMEWECQSWQLILEWTDRDWIPAALTGIEPQDGQTGFGFPKTQTGFGSQQH